MVYECGFCNSSFKSNNKYLQHCKTQKHLRNAQLIPPNICECGKQYKHRQGLCRHKMTCPAANGSLVYGSTNTRTLPNNGIVNNTMNNTTNIQTMNVEVKTQNHYDSPVFNFNFYLSEHCKDAICIEDFCKAITAKLRLVDTSDKDLSLRFTNIHNTFDEFLCKLEKMKAIERPIQSYNGEIVEKSREDWQAVTIDRLNRHVNGITTKVNWDYYSSLPSPRTESEHLYNMQALKKATEPQPPLRGEKIMCDLAKATDASRTFKPREIDNERNEQ